MFAQQTRMTTGSRRRVSVSTCTVGNDGGEAEPQPFQKSKLWASVPTFSHTLTFVFLKEEIQKQRIICVAHSVSCATNRGAETVYFE